jgi:hypothetical protein
MRAFCVLREHYSQSSHPVEGGKKTGSLSEIGEEFRMLRSEDV